MTASNAAAAAETSAMAMEYKAAAEAAQASAEMAAGERGLAITTLANAAANQSAIDSASLVGVPAPPAISNAGRVGAAIGSAAGTSATVAAADTTNNTLATVSQGTTDTTGTASVTAATRHTGSAPRFPVAATNIGGTANTLSRGENPTAFMSRGGWAGARIGQEGCGHFQGECASSSQTSIRPRNNMQHPGTNYISQTNLEIAGRNDRFDSEPSCNHR